MSASNRPGAHHHHNGVPSAAESELKRRLDEALGRIAAVEEFLEGAVHPAPGHNWATFDQGVDLTKDGVRRALRRRAKTWTEVKAERAAREKGDQP